jgi:hypothetical protein
LEKLKKFTIGQGLGWGDNDILKHNGFSVVVGNNYQGLFKMVADNRFDLFARGNCDVMDEYDIYKKKCNLILDDSVAIFYPLPRYFITHNSNKEAVKRVTEVLLAAYEDGSFMALWTKHHADNIRRINLSKRIVFRLENPFLEGIDRSYEKYMYNPQ